MEMIVAVGVFSIVATLSVSSLLILTAAERRVFNNQTNQDNVRFALEVIAREIRLGRLYHGCAGASSPDSCFAFENAFGEDVWYRLNGGAIERSLDNVTYQPITAPEVDIQSLRFYWTGETEGDDLQPRVTIVIKALSPRGGENQSVMDLQTTVSQLDIDA